MATQTTSGYLTALEIAESSIAGLSAQTNPLGEDSGETNTGFRWQTRVTSFQLDANSPLSTGNDFADAEVQFIPYQFEVEVQWGIYRTYHLELSTVRLGIVE